MTEYERKMIRKMTIVATVAVVLMLVGVGVRACHAGTTLNLNTIVCEDEGIMIDVPLPKMTKKQLDEAARIICFSIRPINLKGAKNEN